MNVPARLAGYVNVHLVIGVSVIVMTVLVEGKLEIRNKGRAHGNVRRLCTGVHLAVYFGIEDTARAKEWWLRTGLDGAAYVRILDTGVETNNGCAQGTLGGLLPKRGDGAWKRPMIPNLGHSVRKLATVAYRSTLGGLLRNLRHSALKRTMVAERGTVRGLHPNRRHGA